MTALLRVDEVSKSYGGFQALRNVSFEVKAGETFAIIGPNGAGKTTLFRVMTGEVAGTTGRIYLDGGDITRTGADDRVRMGIGRTFQIVRVFPEFTLMENMVVAIEARNRTRGIRTNPLRARAATNVLDEAYHRLGNLRLAALHATEARHLSLGDRKRLEFAMTLALEPLVLMLDEPTAGMSPSERSAIIDLIERTKAEMGITIVLTEHDMDFVFRLSGTLMVMNQGEKIMSGPPDMVRSSAVVRDIYLGKDMADA